MALSKEERSERAAKRFNEKEKDRKQFPGCHINVTNAKGNYLQLIVKPGRSGNWLTVRTNAPTEVFRPSAIGGDSGWVQASFHFRDVEDLASLVTALAVHLEPKISALNEQIARINATSALKIERNKEGAE